MAKRKRKPKRPKKLRPPMIDDLNDDDIKKIKRVLRQAWSWSYSRRLVIKRCDIGGGYSRCEGCKKKVPKIFVDHIEAIGTFDPKTYILRSFVPSRFMQGLCQPCHKVKTKADMKAMKEVSSQDFY